MANVDPKYIEELNRFLDQDDDTLEPDDDLTIDIGLEESKELKGNIPAGNTRATEQALLYIVVDKSGSMRYNGLEKGVIEGLKEVKKAVNGSKELDYVQTAMTFFGSTLDMRPFRYGENIDISYEANEGATRMYDAIVESANNMLKQHEAMKKEAVHSKGVMFVFTDGGENGSQQYGLRDVRDSIEWMNEMNLRFVLVSLNGANLSDFGDELGVEPVLIEDESQLRRIMVLLSVPQKK